MDTTVILAQPRVSRLRADVVYVHSWGMLGHARASAEIDRTNPGEFSGGGPFSGLRVGEFSEKIDVSVGEILPLKSLRSIYQKEPQHALGSTVLWSFSPDSLCSIFQK